MATFQIWLRTVETRGGYPGKRVFLPFLPVFWDAFVSLSYLSFLLLLSIETSQAACLVDGLQVCQVKWADKESHVTYESPKTSSQITNFLPGLTPRCLLFVLKVDFGANWSHTKSGGKPLKRDGARVEIVFCASCACVLPNRLFLVAFESWYSLGMSHLLFRQYFDKRDGLQGNWSYLSILATLRMGESPLNWTCIFVCTTQWTWNCTDGEVESCSLLLSIFDKVAWNGSKLQELLSLRMRNSDFLVYRFSCVDCTSGMLYFVFL